MKSTVVPSLRRFGLAVAVVPAVSLLAVWWWRTPERPGRGPVAGLVPPAASRSVTSLPEASWHPRPVGRRGLASTTRAILTERRSGLLRDLALAATDADRVAAAVALAEEWAGADSLEVLPLLETLPEKARDLLGFALIEIWRRENPAEAAELVLALFPAGKQTALLQQVLLGWTMQDWSGAVGFVQELPAGPDRIAALRQVMAVWLRNDPAAASTAVAKLAGDDQALLGLTASLWVRYDAEAAATWADNLPDGAAKNATVSALVAAWAQKDPLGAAEHVLGRPAPSGVVISIISGLAAQAPDLATELAMTFPAGKDRDYAMENAYYRWAQADPAAAIEGANRLGWGAERDKAIYAVAGSLVATNPAVAARSALAINDTNLRNHQAERAAREWLKLDPPTARHWILTSPLPDRTKNALLGPGGA